MILSHRSVHILYNSPAVRIWMKNRWRVETESGVGWTINSFSTCGNIRLLWPETCYSSEAEHFLPSCWALYHTCLYCQHTESTPTNSTEDQCNSYSDNTGDWLLNRACATYLAQRWVIHFQLIILTSVSTKKWENEIELNRDMDWRRDEATDYCLWMRELNVLWQWQWKWGFPPTVRWGLNRTAHDKSNDLLSKWNIWCHLHNLHTHDLQHHKVMAVIYLPASCTLLLPTGSCLQHHSEDELESSCKTDRVINLMLPVFVVKKRAMSTLIWLYLKDRCSPRWMDKRQTIPPSLWKAKSDMPIRCWYFMVAVNFDLIRSLDKKSEDHQKHL